MRLIFVALCDYENFLTTKIFRFTVCVIYYMYLVAVSTVVYLHALATHRSGGSYGTFF